METLDIRGFLQPFRVGGDLGLFLINFERTCTKLGLADSDWAQRLLSVLPGEAADVVARLDPDSAQDYFKVKESLLRKFRLSPEAFRVKFREATKRPEESYSEFAYRLQGFLESWLRGVNAYGDREKILEHIGLEHFFNSISSGIKLWIQDRPDVVSVLRAADYADEYYSRHENAAAESK